MEYVITSTIGQYVVMSAQSVQWTRSIAFASKFTNKDRASAHAAKCGGVVEAYWGGVVSSTKSTVMPKQNDRNRRSNYRSI